MSENSQSRLESSTLPVESSSHNVRYEQVDQTEAEESQDLFTLISDRMSGRWKYAIPLALLLASLGAAGGYFFTGTYYESQALIHVAPKTTPLMHETIETRMIPNYGAYVNSQATLLSSSRVLERALNSLDLSNLPYGNRGEALYAMERNINARAERQSELIRVTYRADSADVAQTVLNSILTAYDDLYASSGADEFNRRMSQLRRLRETVRTQMWQKRNEIQDLIRGGEFAVSDFNRLIEDRALQIQDMQSKIRQLEMAIAGDDRESSVAVDWERNERFSEMNGELLLEMYDIDTRELEAYDNELARLAESRRKARMTLEHMADQFHPEHRRYREAERHLATVERLYRERAEEIVGEFLQQPAKRAARQIAYLSSEIEQLRQQTRQMGDTQLALNELRNELREYEEQYARVDARIRQMEIESEGIRTGNISIAATADLPTSPSYDRRRAIAALGAVCGLSIGFGLMFLLGSIDRRAYAVHQLVQNRVGGRHLLGVLPSLRKASGDEEPAHIAAHCVHQIRNQIEAIRRPAASAVVAISSPNQGDGKTSLTLALGASYAVSGLRTIIVDCDLVGQRLTDHLILNKRPGLQEALLTGNLNGEIYPMQLNNLSAMPAGADPNFGSERLRKADLRTIFEQLRQNFDIILVDTGPLCGSIEGLPVVSASDGVVLTIRRGSKQAGLQHAIRAIDSVGAVYLGVVLNHAMARDCDRYVSKSNLLHTEPVGGSTNGDSSHDNVSVRSNVLHDAVTSTSCRPRDSRPEENR